MTLTPEDILRDAAVAIETYGHTKSGLFRDDDGCFCALGGMAYAAGKPLDDDWTVLGDACIWSTPFITAASLLAEAAGLSHWHKITQWNDIWAASKTEVIAKLREAADLAATRE